MKINTMHTKPSTYVGLAAWGATGFMAQPSMASFLVHFIIAPVLIGATIWLAHWEATKDS